MAKKGKSDNYDALGSIFDFMFEESRKAPNKRRPTTVRPTQLAGDSMLVDAIAASLEKPGFFVSDTLVDELNSALEIELSVTPYKSLGSVKVTSNNLIDLIRDPEGFIDKSIKKTQILRKTKRASFLGDNMKDLSHAAWARKYGNLEAQRMVIASGASRRQEEKIKRDQEYKVSSAIGQMSRGFLAADTDKNLMADRAAELIARSTFSNWESVSNDDQKEEFFRLLSNSALNTDFKKGFQVEFKKDFENYVRRYYSGQDANALFDQFSKAYGKGIYDTSTYKSLELGELRRKIQPLEDLESSSKISEDQAKELSIYRKTQILISEDKNKITREIGQIKGFLRNPNLSSDQKKLYKAELKDRKSLLRTINGNTFWGNLGTYEGWYYSIRDVYGGITGTNVAVSILNGSFYDKKRNNVLLPVSENELLLQKKSREKDIALEYLVAADSKNALLNVYNNAMTSVYYLTPRSMFRTLFYNGEGFAYLMHNRVKGMQSILQKNGIQDDYIKEFMGIFNSQMGLDFKTSLDDQILLLSKVLDPNTVSKLKGLAKSAGKFKNLAEKFSGLFKLQKNVTRVFAKQAIKIRAGIVKALYKNPAIRKWFAKNTAGKLLGQWISKGGIDVLVKSVVTAIATALGTTMGPIGNAIAFLVSSIVTDLALKLLGATLNIIKYMVLGVVALMIIVLVFAGGKISKMNKLISKAYLTPPAKVQQCTLYEEMELEEGDTYPWGDVIMPPPSGEECLFGTGTFYCSQGYVDVTGGSHQNYTQNLPVDLTQVSSINAPQFCDKSAGNCTITRVAKIQCSDNSDAGGIAEMDATYNGTTYHFKFLHVGTSLSVGDKLGPGDPVAVVQQNLQKGNCWTGMHLHLEIKQNGSSVDPLEVMQAFGCNLPDETGCKNPPF